MKVIEYGKENHEVILLLHGGGLSWWNYREVANLLQHDYHVVIPIIDGHSGSDKPFISIEETASRMIEYIDKNFQGSILLLGGLSLGGQIVVEMLSKRKDLCRFAIIESALVIPMKLTHFLVKPTMDMSYGLIKQKWFAKLQFKSLRIKKDLYEDYYRDTCQITKEDMTSFLKANSNYIVKESLKDTQAKVYIFVGQKEQAKMIRSAQLLNQIIPNSILEVKDKMYHGEFSMNYAKQYYDKMIHLLNTKR